jgi:hypothetical protein
MASPGFESVSRASWAVSPGAGVGLGASRAAPEEVLSECVSKWLIEVKNKVKERVMFGYGRFYPIRDLQPPVSALRKYCVDKAAFRNANAIWEIFAVEASSAYAPFIEFYANATHDLIEDNFKRDLELVKRVLKEYEKEYVMREKLVITRTGKHVYVKERDNKIMLSGDTYPIKDELKKLGFKWDPVERAWYAPSAKINISVVKAKLEVA